MIKRIFVLSANYFMLALAPIWVSALFIYAFFTDDAFKAARRGDGYIL